MELTEQQIKECSERLKKVEETHKNAFATVEQTLFALLHNSGNLKQVRHNLLDADVKQAHALKEIKDIAKDYNLFSVQAITLYLEMTEMGKTIRDIDNKLVELINKGNEGNNNE